MSSFAGLQTAFLGHKPAGFTSPAWKNHPEQITLLEKHGIKYDHSFMHDDFQPYYVSSGKEAVVTTDYTQDPATWMVPNAVGLSQWALSVPVDRGSNCPEAQLQSLRSQRPGGPDLCLGIGERGMRAA